MISVFVQEVGADQLLLKLCGRTTDFGLSPRSWDKYEGFMKDFKWKITNKI